MISDTNGLLGAADGAFILQKRKRTDPTATMQVVGRDQPDQELTLEFDQEQDDPYIKRTIGGREYTVKIHFKPDVHETAAQKMKRILRNAVKSGKISA